MAITNFAAVANDVRPYLSKRLLDLISFKTVLKQYAYMEAIPAGNGKSMTFVQYTNLTPPAGTLTDGVTPSDDILVTTPITATVDQVGQFVTLTDLAELTVVHPVVEATMQNLAQSAARAYDNRIQAALNAGTNVQYANGKATRILTAAADVMTTSEFSKVVAKLRNGGAETFDGGNFVMVVDPSVEQDITNDTKFFTAAQYSQVARVNANEVGTWMGVTVVRSNNIPTLGAVGASGAILHKSYVFGKNAYAVTDLQSLNVFVEGSGGNTDPLHQRKTIGFKFSNKAIVLNNAWLWSIESGSSY